MNFKSFSIHLLSVLCALPLFTTAQVSNGKFNKLFDLYVLGDFEKCAMKAEKMTEKDKYKRESEPYLYLSMCMLAINDDPELRELEEFDDAIKDAIKYGEKFVKKDMKRKEKEMDYLYEDNYEYIQKLKRIASEEGKSYLAQNDFRKANYYYKYALRLDENEPTILLMKGVTDLMTRNRKEGDENIENALSIFRDIKAKGAYDLAPEMEGVFEDGFLYYADYLIEENQIGKAQEVMELARTLAPENQKFVRKLNQIKG